MKYETSEELLKDEYLETYNKIKLYATVSGVITVSDEILCDMVEILLTAQKNETPVENIVGKDMQEFCESLFSVISKEDRIKVFLRKLFQFSVIFFFIELGSFIIDLKKYNNILNITSDSAPFIFSIMAAVILIFILDYFFKNNMFKWKEVPENLYMSLLIMIYGIGIMFCFLSYFVLNIFIPEIYILTFLFVYIFIYSSFWMYDKLKKGKMDFEERVYVKEDEEYNELEEMISSFHTKNIKLKKKGKSEISIETYTKKLKRTWRISASVSFILIFINVFHKISDEVQYRMAAKYTIADFLFSSVFDLFALYIVVWWFIIPLFKTFSIPLKVLEKCEKKNMNLIEYKEYLDSITNETEVYFKEEN